MSQASKIEWTDQPHLAGPAGAVRLHHCQALASMAGFERIGKKAAGRLLDGREWNEFPEARA